MHGLASTLSPSEQAQVLRNHIAFLEEELADKAWSIDLLERDNAEMDFLGSISPWEKARSAPIWEQNRDRIAALRLEARRVEGQVRLFREVLWERFGEQVA